jgi:hypothetical protein
MEKFDLVVKRMRGLVNLMHRNEKRWLANFATKDELEASMNPRII